MLVEVVVVVVGKRRSTKTTIKPLPLPLLTPQIQPPNIQFDKLLLLKAATITTIPTMTQPPPIPNHKNHHKNKPINITNSIIPTTKETLKYGTPTTITFATLTGAPTPTITIFECMGMVLVLVVGVG